MEIHSCSGTFIYINPEKMASNGHLFCKELIFNAQYTKRERRGGKRIRVRQPFQYGLHKYTFFKIAKRIKC